MQKKLDIPNQSPVTTMRMKPEEKARFLRAAEADGFKSLGTWLKHLARDRADKLNVE
ncbi:hypothetical protein [Vibrio agarivorans]|uniref:Toxin-antitoxin system HicB family antitoxin n=1 Tax=Vibrio agarivorans TaxID=153622 RepID=A0ABT7Y0Z7_9VIBR|nr:hypothetical protein [Vibrio agarivorans]MDN2481655.1 hypothetical protein [Vibrio agarivorans]